MAAELGVSQQAISKMEQSEKIEDDALERVARVLGVPAAGIKQFSDEAFISFIGNSYDNAASYSQYYNFNPIEKIVALYDEKVQLLERLLASEREKVDLLLRKRD